MQALHNYVSPSVRVLSSCQRTASDNQQETLSPHMKAFSDTRMDLLTFALSGLVMLSANKLFASCILDAQENHCIPIVAQSAPLHGGKSEYLADPPLCKRPAQTMRTQHQIGDHGIHIVESVLYPKPSIPCKSWTGAKPEFIQQIM